MASKSLIAVLAAAVLLVATAMGGAGVAAAKKCDARELVAVCGPAFIDGSAPTASCCANLRSHEPCFCLYVRNPAYSRYVNNPNSGKTLTSCGVPTPHC